MGVPIVAEISSVVGRYTKKGLRVSLKIRKKRKRLEKNEIMIGEKKRKKGEYMVARDNENVCKKNGYTSNSGLSRKIGWVAKVSSL